MEAQESSSRMGEAQEAASACIEAHCQEAAPADIEAQFLLKKKKQSMISDSDAREATSSDNEAQESSYSGSATHKGPQQQYRGARVHDDQRGTRGRIGNIEVQESSPMIREAQ